MLRRLIILSLAMVLLILATACDRQEPTTQPSEVIPTIAEEPKPTVSLEPEQTTEPIEAPTEPVEPIEAAVTFNNLHVSSPDWPEQIIYFLMLDRFADGDPANNDQGAGEYNPEDASRYSGGDLSGVINQLDYIEGLGATAVWITPPVANQWWNPLVNFSGYHGYWAENFKQVDAHYGDLETYQALSDALHQRGMVLIQDIVTNHTGDFFTYSDENGQIKYDASQPSENVRFNSESVPVTAPSQAPFDQNRVTDPDHRQAAIYHWTPMITDFSNEQQLLTYQLADLDDLNSENPEVRQALRDSYAYWIENVGVDAFRVDTVLYAEHDFWNDFMYSPDAQTPGMKSVAAETGREEFFAFGEAYVSSDPFDSSGDRRVASYIGTAEKPELDAVLNFPLYFTINRVFAEGAPTDYLTYRLETAQDTSIFPNPFVIPNFLDNHDVARFSAKGNIGGLKQATMLLMTIPGIPVIYYGTEQGFTEQRPAMFAEGWGSGGQDHYDRHSELYQHIAALAEMRKAEPLFTQGSLTVLQDNMNGPGVFAFRRDFEDETALIIFNTSDRPVLMADLDTALTEGSVLELMSGLVGQEGLIVGQDGLITRELPAREGLVLRLGQETVELPEVDAQVTIETELTGQVFSEPFEVSGTVSQAQSPVNLIINDNLASVIEATSEADGRWLATVPMDRFPPGLSLNTLIAYAPELLVASDPITFEAEVTSTEAMVTIYDQIGDDVGPRHVYQLPTDETFGDQMDILSVSAAAFGTNLMVSLEPAEISDVWDPANGFDHVLYHVFIDLPGQTGLTVLPLLNANTPEGFEWDYLAFIEGWSNRLYSTDGASADSYGASVTPAPVPSVDEENKRITFLFTSDALGNPETLEGARIYISAWDWNGVDQVLRPLRNTAGQWHFGGGDGQVDPLIIDDTEILEIFLDSRVVKEDPAGDDTAPDGLYTLPADESIGQQMDIRRASLVQSKDGLRLDMKMSEVTDEQAAPNAFDHVMFHIFLDVPGKEGVTPLPLLHAQTPSGMAWDYAAVISGWESQLFAADGATAEAFGPEQSSKPTITINQEEAVISVLFSPESLGGISTLDDLKVYVATWDWDDTVSAHRPLTPEGGQFEFGGGDGTSDPLIIDDVVVGLATVYKSPLPPVPKAQITLLVTIPESTPVEEGLYITGPFNSWTLKDPAYQFTDQGDGTYLLVLELEEGEIIEYRIGRGSLANTELLDSDDRFANRQIEVLPGAEDQTIEIAVEGWWDQ